jgi:hypothetical protein
MDFITRARSSEEAPPPVDRAPSPGIDSEQFHAENKDAESDVEMQTEEKQTMDAAVASPAEETEDAAQETKEVPQQTAETPQKETDEVPQENEQKRRRAKRLVQMDLFGKPVSERLLCEHFEALNAEPPSMALLVASGSVSMEMVMSETEEAQQETETPLKQETGETTEKREEQNEESEQIQQEAAKESEQVKEQEAAKEGEEREERSDEGEGDTESDETKEAKEEVTNLQGAFPVESHLPVESTICPLRAR